MSAAGAAAEIAQQPSRRVRVHLGAQSSCLFPIMFKSHDHPRSYKRTHTADRPVVLTIQQPSPASSTADARPAASTTRQPSARLVQHVLHLQEQLQRNWSYQYNGPRPRGGDALDGGRKGAMANGRAGGGPGGHGGTGGGAALGQDARRLRGVPEPAAPARGRRRLPRVRRPARQGQAGGPQRGAGAALRARDGRTL